MSDVNTGTGNVQLGNVQPTPQGVPSAQPVAPPAIQPPAQPPTGQPQAAQQAQPTAPQPAPAGDDQGTGPADGVGVTRGDGKTFVVAESAFKRIKDEQREKGRIAAMEEMAKENGFESVEAMQATLKGRRSRSSTKLRTRRRSSAARRSAVTQPRQTTTDANDGAGDGDGVVEFSNHPEFQAFQRQMRRMEKRLKRSESLNTDTSKRLSAESRARKRLRRERDALEAEMVVREAAAHSGLHDIDYAMRLLTRDLNGKSEEDLKKFNEIEYFESLRGDHPHLFGETRKPATTGNGANAPGAPNPGAAQQGAAQGGQVDARKMDPKQFQDHLRARGLNLNM